MTDEEFARTKDALFGGSGGPGETGSIPPSFNPGGDVMDPETRQWGMILRLSVFAGYIVPLAGLIAPIVIWQIKKNELPGIDAHGKNLINWMISMLIYSAVAFVLCFILIGIPILLVLGVLGVVFPIIAAIKANNGEIWPYPLTIHFLK